MNSQDYRNLQEAYLNVYGQEESLDEGIGSAIKGLFAKKKKPEAPKPLSPGAQLRQKYGTETSPKQQILAKTRERAERDEKEYGDSPYSKSVATKSREAHNTRLRAGFSLYGAGEGSGGEGGSGGRGGGHAARRRAEKLNNSYDLFDYMMEYLISEGYADTNENALVIMANMSEEWRESICEANRGDEYATRGMSPEASKTWKSERRNRTRGFSSDVEEKERNDKRYKEKYGKHPSPDPNNMGGSQSIRQADTKDNRGKRTTLIHTTNDTLSSSGIRGTVTKPEIRIGTPLGGTKNPEPKGKYLHRQQVKDAQSSDPTKRSRAPQNYLYHMN
jgi:hypothetical protein